MKSLLVVVLVGIIVFGYAELCNAQCAWVLWKRGGSHIEIRWFIEDAFPTYEKCKQNQLVQCKREHKRLLEIITTTLIKSVEDNCPDSLTIIYKDSSSPNITIYKCLPDTIDPRK